MRMGITSPDADPRPHREAARWLVQLLDSDLRDPRQAGFQRWVSADPARASAYREAERLWKLSEEAARHPAIRAASARALHPVPANTMRMLRIWLAPAVSIAAAMVAMTGLALYMWAGLVTGPTTFRYVTRTGQQQDIQLLDGSAMLLDTGSAVVVRYEPKTRQVTLLHGRAEFRVRHDQDWPFVVHAGGGTVTDVGTTFQVGIGRRGDVNVVLLEGQVSVAAAHSKATLTSGEALRFNHTGIVNTAPADLSAALGWTSGEVIAHGWPLPRLLATMNRYSDTKIELADPVLRDVRITGTFKAGDQETLLRILEAGWPIRVKRLSENDVELLRDAASSAAQGMSAAAQR